MTNTMTNGRQMTDTTKHKIDFGIKLMYNLNTRKSEVQMN